MAIQVCTLPELIDLALRTPVIGVVNFDILRTVLHILIKQMGLSNFRAKVNIQDMKPQKLDIPQPPRRPSAIAHSVSIEHNAEQHFDDEVGVPDAEDIDSQNRASFDFSQQQDENEGERLTGSVQSNAQSSEFEMPTEHRESVAATETYKQEKAFVQQSHSKLSSDISIHQGPQMFHEDMSEFWKSTNISSRISALESGIEKIVDIIDEQARDLEHFRRDSERRRAKDNSIIKQLKEDVEGFTTTSSDIDKKLKVYIKDDEFQAQMDRQVNYIDDMNSHLQDLEDRLDFLSEKLKGDFKMKNILDDIYTLKTVLKMPTEKRRPSLPETESYGGRSSFRGTPRTAARTSVPRETGTEVRKTPQVTDMRRYTSEKRISAPESRGLPREDTRRKESYEEQEQFKPVERQKSAVALKEEDTERSRVKEGSKKDTEVEKKPRLSQRDRGGANIVEEGDHERYEDERVRKEPKSPDVDEDARQEQSYEMTDRKGYRRDADKYDHKKGAYKEDYQRDTNRDDYQKGAEREQRRKDRQKDKEDRKRNAEIEEQDRDRKDHQKDIDKGNHKRGGEREESSKGMKDDEQRDTDRDDRQRRGQRKERTREVDVDERHKDTDMYNHKKDEEKDEQNEEFEREHRQRDTDKQDSRIDKEGEEKQRKDDRDNHRRDREDRRRGGEREEQQKRDDREHRQRDREDRRREKEREEQERNDATEDRKRDREDRRRGEKREEQEKRDDREDREKDREDRRRRERRNEQERRDDKEDHRKGGEREQERRDDRQDREKNREDRRRHEGREEQERTDNEDDRQRDREDRRRGREREEQQRRDNEDDRQRDREDRRRGREREEQQRRDNEDDRQRDREDRRRGREREEQQRRDNEDDRQRDRDDRRRSRDREEQQRRDDREDRQRDREDRRRGEREEQERRNHNNDKDEQGGEREEQRRTDRNNHQRDTSREDRRRGREKEKQRKDDRDDRQRDTTREDRRRGREREEQSKRNGRDDQRSKDTEDYQKRTDREGDRDDRKRDVERKADKNNHKRDEREGQERSFDEEHEGQSDRQVDMDNHKNSKRGEPHRRDDKDHYQRTTEQENHERYDAEEQSRDEYQRGRNHDQKGNRGKQQKDTGGKAQRNDAHKTDYEKVATDDYERIDSREERAISREERAASREERERKVTKESLGRNASREEHERLSRDDYRRSSTRDDIERVSGRSHERAPSTNHERTPSSIYTKVSAVEDQEEGLSSMEEHLESRTEQERAVSSERISSSRRSRPISIEEQEMVGSTDEQERTYSREEERKISSSDRYERTASTRSHEKESHVADYQREPSQEILTDEHERIVSVHEGPSDTLLSGLEKEYDQSRMRAYDQYEEGETDSYERSPVTKMKAQRKSDKDKYKKKEAEETRRRELKEGRQKREPRDIRQKKEEPKKRFATDDYQRKSPLVDRSYAQREFRREDQYEHQGKAVRDDEPRGYTEEEIYRGFGVIDMHTTPSVLDRDIPTDIRRSVEKIDIHRTLEAIDMQNVIGAAAEFEELQNAIEDLRLKIDKMEDQNKEIRRMKEEEALESEERLAEKERLIDKLTAGMVQSSDKMGDVQHTVQMLSEKVYEVIEMVKEIGKIQDEMAEEGRKNLQEVEEQMREIFKELRKFAMLDDIQLMVEDIKHSKAERSELFDSLDRKADKTQLESKLDKTMFESICDNFNRGFDDLIVKMAGQEQQLERAVQDLNVLLEQKVEKKEMDVYREHMKDRVKAIVTKLKQMKEIIEEDPDAAGIKIRCLSCDRPLRKPDRNFVVSDGTLNTAMPKRLSDIPPESSGFLPPIQGTGAVRATGGWHTLTSPPLRIRTTAGTGFPADKMWEEVPLQGADGRVYQGYVEKPSRTPPA